MSGMTRSMPSISCSGNIRPASTTTMSSSYCTAIMLRPISRRPPRGRMVSRPGPAIAALSPFCVSEQGHLLVRGCLCGLGLRPRLARPLRLGLVEVAAHLAHVLFEGCQQAAVVERGGGMVQRHVETSAVADARAVRARDARRAGEDALQRVAAQQQDDVGPDQLDLRVEEVGARFHLLGQRIAVARRAALEHVADVEVAALEADSFQQLCQQLPRRADEGLAHAVLGLAGGLPRRHDPRRHRAIAGDRLDARLRQRAGDAGADLLVEGVESGSGGGETHARAAAGEGAGSPTRSEASSISSARRTVRSWSSGTRGSRAVPTFRPRIPNAALTGMGLAVMNRPLKRGSRRRCRVAAWATSPATYASMSRRIAAAQTCAATLMTPWAPMLSSGRVLTSSPLQSRKSSGAPSMIRAACSKSPLDSLVPTMLGCCARRSCSDALMLITLRDGML